MEQNSDLPARRFLAASFRGGILSVLYQDGAPVRLDLSKSGSSLVGNIYLGRVQHIVKNLGAVFVDLGEEKPAFLADAGKYALGNPDDAAGGAGRRLREGDSILVKVKKDAHGIKGPTVTSGFPEKKDKALLDRASFRNAPARLLTAEPSWLSMLRESLPDASSAEILTDSAEVFETLTGEKPAEEEPYRKKLPDKFRSKAALPRDRFTGAPVRFRSDPDLSLASLYSLETLLQDCTARKVWLKGGGFLVIDPTEAMTVIDVNSGKFERAGNRRETIRRVDLEAAAEIMRQIRLRNLSGIIVADFIDLRETEDQEALLSLLRKLAAEDPVQTEVVDLTKLNLVEMTRKKSGRTLSEQMQKFS